MKKIILDELNRIDIDAFKAADKTRLNLVLDNIRSTHNVGALFRTADAFRLEQLILTGITAQPPHREIQKTALGATESVTWRYEQDVLEAIKQLKAEGYHILIAEQTDDSTMLQDLQLDPNKRYALVMGNEVNGVSESILPHIDECVEIPQFGTKHSLNVSVSGGIIIWACWQQIGVGS